MRAVGLHFGIEEITAHHGLHAEGGEELGSDLCSEGVLGLAVGNKSEGIAAVGCEGLNGLRRARPVQKVRVGDLRAVVAVVGLRARLADMEERGGFAIGKRAQEGRIDDGENGGVGADTEGQRQDDDGGEAGAVAKRADGVAQVLQERAHRESSKYK